MSWASRSIPALSSLVQDGNEGWVRWAATLATAGFIISSVGYTLSIAKLPGIALAFVHGDASTKAALAAVWKSSIDLFGLWGYGTVGLWIFVVSSSALRKTEFPKALAYLGILYGILFLLVPAGTIFKMQTPLLAAAVLGATVGPIWWIWTGTDVEKRFIIFTDKSFPSFVFRLQNLPSCPAPADLYPDPVSWIDRQRRPGHDRRISQQFKVEASGEHGQDQCHLSHCQ